MFIGPRTPSIARLLVAGVIALSGDAGAQDIEPREFSNAPVGVNFLIAGYVHTQGGLSVDPSVPLTDARLTTSSAVLAYARALDLFGASGKIDVVLPYSHLSGSALYAGSPVDRAVDGFIDPAFRVSVNFYGAPALTLPEFRGYKQDLIVGGSFRVTAPLGQYDPARLVNLGTNRWSFKPELGLSKALGPWTLEVMAEAQSFTANGDFYGGHRRTVDPVYSVQGQAILNFPSGWWAAVDATYYRGGQPYVDGDKNGVELANWRYGATLVAPIDLHNSIKGYASNGVSSRTSANFKLVGVVWQTRWGGGL